jgi:hypothetical protein
MAGVVGVEPTTNRLTVYCANHCATPQHQELKFIGPTVAFVQRDFKDLKH